MEAIENITKRYSALKLTDPAPDQAALEQMMEAANRAPDHGRLRPWRFIALRGEARDRFGDVLVETLKKRNPDVIDTMVDRERAKPMRAPLILVAVAKTQESKKIPEIEQIVAVGAATQNVMLAAHAMGYGAMWRTGDSAYDDGVKKALGLDPKDTIVGYVYLGTAAVPGMPPKGMEEVPVLSEWTGPAA